METKIKNRPKTIKVKNKRLTVQGFTKYGSYNCPVEKIDKGFKIYPYENLPDLYVVFDENGEFIYQNEMKDKDDKNIEWYIPF